MELVRDILTNPAKAILNARKHRSLNRTLSILVASWVIIGLGFLFAFYRVSTFSTALGLSLVITVFGLIFSLVYGYVIDIVMNVLGGKGKYYEGLTSAAYSLLPISLGILATSLLSMLSVILGGVVGFVAIVVTAALSLSIYFRAIKEFYSTDMVVTFVGFLITLYVFLIAAYLSIGFSVGSSIFSMLPIQIA